MRDTARIFDQVPEVFAIARGTRELIFSYARTICEEVAQRPVETGGYLFREIDTPYSVAVAASLADHLSSHTDVLLTNKQQSLREYAEKGYEPIGWWHLHPDFGAFMSHIDEPTTAKLLHQFSPATFHKSFLAYADEKQNWQNNLEVMLDNTLKLSISESGDLGTSQLAFTSAWAYALTINLAGAMYASIARKAEIPWAGESHVYQIRKNVPVLEWERGNAINLTSKEIRAEAKRKWRAYTQEYD